VRLSGRIVLGRADHPVADGTGDADRRAHFVTIGVTTQPPHFVPSPLRCSPARRGRDQHISANRIIRRAPARSLCDNATTRQCDGARDQGSALVVRVDCRGRGAVSGPGVGRLRLRPDGTTGTWRVNCGRNEQGIYNSDNLIGSPGVAGGAHHLHDYVGNVSTDAFSTDQSLAAADMTCPDDDRST
jgi:hypothetical protein